MDQVLTAFINKKRKTVNNTRTDGDQIELFGNRIVWRDENNDYFISTCGWNTITTQERLNFFLREIFDYKFYVKRHRGSSYLEIDNKPVLEITEPINISKIDREGFSKC